MERPPLRVELHQVTPCRRPATTGRSFAAQVDRDGTIMEDGDSSSSSSGSDDDESMDEDGRNPSGLVPGHAPAAAQPRPPPPPPVVDEDGFELVQKGRRGRR